MHPITLGWRSAWAYASEEWEAANTLSPDELAGLVAAQRAGIDGRAGSPHELMTLTWPGERRC